MTQPFSPAPNRRIVLASRPIGMPRDEDFRLETVDLPPLREGEVLYGTTFLSIDPFIRARMAPGSSYAAPIGLGETIAGFSSGEVIASRHPRFAEGDLVVGAGGWQRLAISSGGELRKLETAKSIHLRLALGVLGMPGLTAYVGLLDLGGPSSGEAVLVSSAAGTVGSIVGQIAKIHGCRVVGIAGGAEKCRWVTDTLGFDACVDYRASADFQSTLSAACPGGVDIYFDNVGGDILTEAIRHLNVHARVVLCGMVSAINAEGPIENRQDLRPLFVKRAALRPILVSDHMDRMPEYVSTAEDWIARGLLRSHEEVIDGFDQAPSALRRLLGGEALGKLLVRCDDAATQPKFN